jgi:hypothetical protein
VLLYVVILLRSDKPETNKDDVQVVALFKVVIPDTFNDDLHVAHYFKLLFIIYDITYDILLCAGLCGVTGALPQQSEPGGIIQHHDRF